MNLLLDEMLTWKKNFGNICMWDGCKGFYDFRFLSGEEKGLHADNITLDVCSNTKDNNYLWAAI